LRPDDGVDLMSYREQDGQVILTMSREDYQHLLFALGEAAACTRKFGGDLNGELSFLNRLNEGNPHYTPYQVEAEKK
jgi:hypothetical protein